MCSPISPFMFIRGHVAQDIVHRRCILVMGVVYHFCLALFRHPEVEAGMLSANSFIVLRSAIECVWERNRCSVSRCSHRLGRISAPQALFSAVRRLDTLQSAHYTTSSTPLTKQHG